MELDGRMTVWVELALNVKSEVLVPPMVIGVSWVPSEQVAPKYEMMDSVAPLVTLVLFEVATVKLATHVSTAPHHQQT